MMPGSMYLQLVIGQGIGPAARWVTHHSVRRNGQALLHRTQAAGDLPPVLHGGRRLGLAVPGAFVEPVPGAVRRRQDAGARRVHPRMGCSRPGIRLSRGADLFAPRLAHPHPPACGLPDHPENRPFRTRLRPLPDHVRRGKAPLSHGSGGRAGHHGLGGIHGGQAEKLEMAGVFHRGRHRAGIRRSLCASSHAFGPAFHRANPPDPHPVDRADRTHGGCAARRGHRPAIGSGPDVRRHGPSLLGGHRRVHRPDHHRGGQPHPLQARDSDPVAPRHADRGHRVRQQLRLLHELRHRPGPCHRHHRHILRSQVLHGRHQERGGRGARHIERPVPPAARPGGLQFLDLHRNLRVLHPGVRGTLRVGWSPTFRGFSFWATVSSTRLLFPTLRRAWRESPASS